MTPAEFKLKWHRYTGKESSAYQRRSAANAARLPDEHDANILHLFSLDPLFDPLSSEHS